jgi:hypothetical protein
VAKGQHIRLATQDLVAIAYPNTTSEKRISCAAHIPGYGDISANGPSPPVWPNSGDICAALRNPTALQGPKSQGQLGPWRIALIDFGTLAYDSHFPRGQSPPPMANSGESLFGE